MTAAGLLAQQFAKVVNDVDQSIGENRTYGTGIGPHDEDDQIDALVTEVLDRDLFEGDVYTAKSDSGHVRYPDGRSADIVIETDGGREYCEVKLFRFQKATSGQPSPGGFSKVFNPFRDEEPRSFIYDVPKLADSELRGKKTFLAPYYRPVEGGGTGITSEEIAEEFVDAVQKWTDYSITVDNIAHFDDLQHDVHRRGAFLVWELAEQAP